MNGVDYPLDAVLNRATHFDPVLIVRVTNVLDGYCQRTPTNQTGNVSGLSSATTAATSIGDVKSRRMRSAWARQF